MSKSDFTYTIRKIKDQPFIMIEDLNRGRMSVTNNIGNVLDEISAKERINPVEHNIVYKDSEGIWNGYVFSTGQFVPLSEKSWYGAAEKMLNAG